MIEDLLSLLRRIFDPLGNFLMLAASAASKGACARGDSKLPTT
jgi:hypothetical protein